MDKRHMGKSSKKEMELALGWLQGRVRLNEFQKQTKVKRAMTCYPRIALALKEAHRKGDIAVILE